MNQSVQGQHAEHPARLSREAREPRAGEERNGEGRLGDGVKAEVVEVDVDEEHSNGALGDPREVGDDAPEGDPAKLGARQECAGRECLDA